MPKEILDSSDVGAAFEEVGRERMAKRVAGGGLGKPGFAGGFLELTLHGDFVDMVSGNSACSRVWTEGCRRKDELPWPFPGGIGVFPGQGFGQVRIAASRREIAGMLLGPFGEIVSERRFQGARQRDNPVLCSLPVIHDDGSLAEVDVFDP